MNRTTRLLLAATLATTLPFLGGCKSLKERLSKNKGYDAGIVKTTPTSTSGSGTQDPQDLADEMLGQKVGEYIRMCMNAMSSNVYRSRRQYLSWTPKSGGLTGRETRVLGIFEIKGAQTCMNASNKAKNLQPKDEALENAGQKYAKAVVALEPLVKEAFAYYDHKNYKDDKFARGKVLHPQLIAAFDEFVRADKEIHSAVGSVTKPLAMRQLARMEREEGKKFRYHRRNVLNLGRDLVEIGDPSGEDDEVSFALYDGTFLEFEKALGALKDYGTTRRSDLSDPKKSKIGSAAAYDTFMRAADDYLRKSREYGRCLRDAPSFAKTKEGKVDLDRLPKCPDGGRRDFGDKYDNFVVTSNANPFP